MNLVKLGNNIAAARRASGQTQEDVAFGLDISSTAYAKIERGETNVPFKRLIQIAEYLKVEVSDLVREESNKYSFEDLYADIQQIKHEVHSIYELNNL